MQIVHLRLPHSNFFCPVTGQQITGEGLYEPSPALMGVWHCELIDEPEIFDPLLEGEWEGYCAGIGSGGDEDVEEAVEEDFDEDGELDVEAFLSRIENENWVCFAITTTEFACGPVDSTMWFVMDMNYDLEEGEEEEMRTET